MEDILKVCMVQADLIWEDTNGNLNLIGEMLSGIKNQVDLIVLPEMFNTGFTMNSKKMAVDHDSAVFGWMKEKSLQFNAVITGSVIFREGNKIYNRLIWMKPSGDYESYDKRHLFRMGGEPDHYSPGKNKLVTTLKSWRVCPLICYDLRFPVWSRNTESIDLMLYVANWPASRRMVWDALLCARAIENQMYVCGVNRVGTDGEGIFYNGGSVMIDPYGKTVYRISDNIQETGICEISLLRLKEFRDKFPVLKDMDQFTLQF